MEPEPRQALDPLDKAKLPPGRAVIGGVRPAQIPITYSRLTIVGTVSYQPHESQPHHWQIQHSQDLKTEEVPYARPVEVGEGWQSLELGWVNNPSLILLKNRPPVYATIPSQEEVDEAAAKVVEVGIASAHDAGFGPDEVLGFALVRPGASWFLEPSRALDVRVRCRKGSVKLLIVAVPGRE